MRPDADDMTRSEQATGAGGLSQARLARMHTVMAGYVERGEVPGIIYRAPSFAHRSYCAALAGLGSRTLRSQKLNQSAFRS